MPVDTEETGAANVPVYGQPQETENLNTDNRKDSRVEFAIK